MRHTFYGGCLLLTATLAVGGPSTALGQDLSFRRSDGILARGQVDGSYPVPGLPSENVPIPTGNPGQHGFFTFGEFMFLTQTRTIGDQTVAFRGLVDSSGLVTGLPGTYIGSGRPALTTDQLGRNSFAPGYRIGIGYKLDNGVSVWASFTQMMDQTYSASALLVPPFFRSRGDLADTYLVSGVYNFPPSYSGPDIKTSFDADINTPTGNFYGIWNGASEMVISYTNRFTAGEVGARVPMFDTDYSRIYGLGGLRYAWFFERFRWRTVAADFQGVELPAYAANYTNTLSQRMYGPFVGCGHEVYLGKRFGLSLDLTGAALLNIVKERAKYELGDDTTQNKRSRNEFTVVPNANADLNLMWYPIEGVQMRLGYTAQTYFNTRNMLNPIAFDYGAIDPVYNFQAFRLVHGLNVGIGLFF